MLEKLGPNGTLPIRLGWKYAKLKLDITGGPYDAYRTFSDAGTFGVCVRAERLNGLTYDVHLPIHDFSVPANPQRVEQALKETLQAALDGKAVYIGCMGGWGRTGLFMALLAKAAGIEMPVEFVRQTYTNRAVETAEQFGYVKGFDVRAIQKWLVFAAWKARIKRLFR